MNNWIDISEEALAHNFRVLREAAGASTEVLAVIKANAYGHGAEQCARVLARAGARSLGVTCASEGVRVRRALGNALKPEILVMCGSLPEDTALLLEHQLTPVVWTAGQIESLPVGWPVHVEIDTGMGRQGAVPGAELLGLLTEIAARGLTLKGVFTHFCSSEIAGSALTQHQQARFAEAVAQVRDAGLLPAWVHAGNTSTIDNPQASDGWLAALAASVGARAMVRSGLALYGYALPIEGAAEARVHGQLRPVLTWRARVLAVRGLNPGDTVGYNATFTAPKPMRVALLPVGYADGLRRELSCCDGGPDGGGGWVMFGAQRARILGRISMNLTVVDVTEIAGVDAGTEAILLGPGVTAEDHARLAGTISYEILCGIHPCG